MTISELLDISMEAWGMNGRLNPKVYCTSTLTAHPGEFEPAPPLQADGASVPEGAPGQFVAT